MKSGIYLITDTFHNRVYVGQSVNVAQRLSQHKTMLRTGRHKNVYLQRSYNKCGGEGFEFTILERCPIKMLDERETAWIALYQSNVRRRGYNIQSGGHEGHTWNEEAKAARRGKNNPMFGRHQSAEFIQKIRLINRASSDKLTVDDVEKIKQALADGRTQKKLSEEYNVTISTINKIAKCENWDWVLPELNDTIKDMEDEKKRIRNEKMREMYLSGATAQDIAKALNCNPNTVAINIRDLVEARQEAHEELKKKVEQDFLNGLTKNEIVEKYGISRTSYTRYVSDAYNARKRIVIDMVLKMKESGMMVKDIAEELNLHRTTVTEYCKKYGHGNTESA